MSKVALLVFSKLLVPLYDLEARWLLQSLLLFLGMVFLLELLF